MSLIILPHDLSARARNVREPAVKTTQRFPTNGYSGADFYLRSGGYSSNPSKTGTFFWLIFLFFCFFIFSNFFFFS